MENKPENTQPEDENLGNLDSMIEVIIEERSLPCPMTDKERLTIGEELVLAQEQGEQAEDKKKVMDEEFKGVITSHYTTVSRLSSKLRHGKIDRPVQCRIKRDYRLGYISVHRIDDGTEVSGRPMTSEELQEKMKFNEE